MTWKSKGLFTLDPSSEFNVHRMRIRRVHTWIRFGVIHIGCALSQSTLEVDWNWIGTESEPNSLFIHRTTINLRMVTPLWTATLSKLCIWGHHKCSICRPRYELRWSIMLGCYWLDAADKETAYQVVLCSSSKFTFHFVYYQWQGKANNWTNFSVCFDTSRMLAR